MMNEKELSFICVNANCGKVTTVIVQVVKALPTKRKNVMRAYYCEHCNRANKIAIPDNLDVHRFTLGRDNGFLRDGDDGIPLLQGEEYDDTDTGTTV